MIQITPLTSKDHLQHLCEFINCCNLTKVENARARDREPHSANGGAGSGDRKFRPAGTRLVEVGFKWIKQIHASFCHFAAREYLDH